MSKKVSQFQTIRTEGALLPPDVLRRIAAQAVDGVSPESYHLPPSLKLNESISHSWNILRAHWKAFQQARQAMATTEETGTGITNERWMLPLFQELGYGRLLTSKAPEIDGRLYPIERFYNQVPIHLIGCRLPLDRRTKGARGAATSSPHSMVQEYLNGSEESLWGFLSNGLQIRLLRDNVSLSRQAFVEFDLEAMMDGEVFADFALLWMVCHQSRLETPKQKDSWLEKWSGLAREQGTRMLESLRTGVQESIEALGRGFIGHPKNDGLRQKLRDGTLSTQDYYRQLLRIVYRLLFLFVAEDRGLLHSADASEEATQLYDEYYSTARLRRLAQSMRGSKHHDLWSTFSLVCDALGRNEGCPTLGLSGLGSFLWRRSSTSDLLGPAPKGADLVSEPVFLANDDLLSAVRALAYVQQDRSLRTVDYRNLGSEELGSVYESLLELHPAVAIESRTFTLSVAGGNERKTSGSYYTPDSLVQCLLDSALEPVVADRIGGKKSDEAVKAILDLKVCDPACGSGHFLIAAAHRLARHLARAHTGEIEPSPEEYQHALRQVIGRCIYGVDLNPMAVELCKVSLWIEAVEPGKPLSFLDHHIQCGNSLLGTTPALMACGIPDEAFAPIEGDDKKVCRDYRKQNQDERNRQTTMFDMFARSETIRLSNIAPDLVRIETMDDDSIEDLNAKELAYREFKESTPYEFATMLANAWCAAFVIPKVFVPPLEPRITLTESTFRKLENNPNVVQREVKEAIAKLADQYHFFHWHLAFLNVFQPRPSEEIGDEEILGWGGGFDAVLGNPPWETFELKEKEWFAQVRPDIANADNAAARRLAIGRLAERDPALHASFIESHRNAEGETRLIRETGRFPLTAFGKINSYALFAELNRQLLGTVGRVGCITPSGIASDDTTKIFFQNLIESRALVSLHSFENEEFLFPGVHHSTKFCLVTMSGSQRQYAQADFVFFARRTDQLQEPDRHFSLTVDEIKLMNPNTGTCPIFHSKRDAEINKAIYRRVPVLLDEGSPERNPWGISFRQGLFNMASDSGLFQTRVQLEGDGWSLEGDIFRQGERTYLPLYEAKMVHHFDHRFGTYEGQTDAQANQGKLPELDDVQHADPHCVSLPWYWVPAEEVEGRLEGRWDRRWLLGWRDICRNTDTRTVIASLLPRAGVGHTFPLSLVGEDAIDIVAGLYANLATFVLDYLARQKIGGTHVTYGLLKQFPLIPPDAYGNPADWSAKVTRNSWIQQRVLELTYTAWDLAPFARDCGYDGPPFRWDEARRFLLRCELDAAFFHLYGIDRDDAAYIMDTFPIVRRKDEEKYNGDFRTKRVILEIYDAMQEAIATGRPYQTRLDPPPADPRCCHPPWDNRTPNAEALEART